MDGWRKPNHMRSQIGGPKAMRPVNLRRLPAKIHNVAKQASFCIAFRNDVGGFGTPKSMLKIDLRAFFSLSFSKAFLHRNFLGFQKLETRKIAIYFRKTNDFCKISFFDKDAKTIEFRVHFRKPKRGKFQ